MEGQIGVEGQWQSWDYNPTLLILRIQCYFSELGFYLGCYKGPSRQWERHWNDKCDTFRSTWMWVQNHLKADSLGQVGQLKYEEPGIYALHRHFESECVRAWWHKKRKFSNTHKPQKLARPQMWRPGTQWQHSLQPICSWGFFCSH